MAWYDPVLKELSVKVVYYGPGLSGKTSNLKYIYENLEEGGRGKLVELASDSDRTLFFDFLPLEIGQVKGVKVRLQLYTVPGQVFHEETRRRVLQGADGVVFVADSQRSMREANLQSLQQLRNHLAAMGADSGEVPLVLQYNKRDLPGIATLEEMDRDLNPDNRPFFEAIATEGVGVEDTFKAACALVLKRRLSAPLESFPPPAGSREEPALPEEEESLFPESAELLEAESTPSLELPSSSEDSADLLFEEEAQAVLEAAPTSPSEGAAPEGSPSPPASEEAVLLEEAPVEEVAAPPLEPLSLPQEPAGGPLRLIPGQPLEVPVEVEGRPYRLVLLLEALPVKGGAPPRRDTP